MLKDWPILINGFCKPNTWIDRNTFAGDSGSDSGVQGDGITNNAAQLGCGKLLDVVVAATEDDDNDIFLGVATSSSAAAAATAARSRSRAPRSR